MRKGPYVCAGCRAIIISEKDGIWVDWTFRPHEPAGSFKFCGGIENEWHYPLMYTEEHIHQVVEALRGLSLG